MQTKFCNSTTNNSTRRQKVTKSTVVRNVALSAETVFSADSAIPVDTAAAPNIDGPTDSAISAEAGLADDIEWSPTPPPTGVM